MASFDIHNNLAFEIGLPIDTYTATAVSEIVDTLRYEGVEFITPIGTMVDGSWAITVEEGDDAALADAQAVDSDFIIYNAATDLVVDNTKSDTVLKLGYVGKKRYVRVTYTEAGAASSGGVFGMVVVKGKPWVYPTA